MSFMSVVGAISRQEAVETQYDWKVENFFSLSGRLKSPWWHESPRFLFSGRTFYLQVWPYYCKNENGQLVQWIGLLLMLEDSMPPITIRYSLGIKTVSGDTEVWESGTTTLSTMRDQFCGYCGSDTMLKRSELALRRQELAPRDALTFTLSLKLVGPDRGTSEVAVQTSAEGAGVQEANEGLQNLEHTGTAEVTVQASAEDSGVQASNEGCQDPKHIDLVALGQNIKDLYVSGKDCDVTLEVGDKTFRAHRIILKARTPVLAAMFSHNTTEAETGNVCVEDCHPEAFGVFLSFVYSGVAGDLTEQNAMDVYYVADKYDLPGLKKECVRHLLSNLTASSVCSVIALADRHGEEMLQERATAFFVDNAREVFQTPAWRNFIAQNNSLGCDLINRAHENSK